jgi:aquaporin Z
MRAMNIKTFTDARGFLRMKSSFKKNYIHYLQEAFGLAIFMISACFFGGILEAKNSFIHLAITNDFIRIIIMGIMMGLTAYFIFTSPFTSPSGAHINPAVTMVFFRLGKMQFWDVIFYIIFQLLGGLTAVYIMALLMRGTLINAPVNCVVTIPGKYGVAAAAFTEFIIAFIMITMVLFTSANNTLKKYTQIIAACLVCTNVIVAGPISGFGMNPSRTIASAVPAHIYTSFWIYMIIPFAGMLSAAEVFHAVTKKGCINK